MEYKFKKILIGFDGSPASKIALEKAFQTCKAFQSDLFVVNVKNSKSGEASHQQEVESKAQSYGVKIHYMEKSGNVSKEISVTEREIGADLIFMGAHGVQGFQPYWIGSNANRVVSASSCPVITIQEDALNADFSSIILPLDDSVETRQKVPYAVVFARAFHSTIHIFAVSKDTHPDTLRRITAYAHQAEKYLDDRNIKNTTEIRQGKDVPQSCMDYALEKKAGIIMMMTETESAGWFMGTYAQKLINHSPTPILSIHSRDLLLTGSAGY